MPGAEPGEVTRLLQSWGRGDVQALDELTPIVYGELRRIAAAYLHRERRDHTLQPTALVNEAYVRLVRDAHLQATNRTHFFVLAAKLMREILVDHARRHRAGKRGSGNKLTLCENDAVGAAPEVDLIALDKALDKLARLDERQGRIVELRFFGGLTEDEIAEALGLSRITVAREWRLAKAVLRRELSA